jgi:hypothetical protein
MRSARIGFTTETGKAGTVSAEQDGQHDGVAYFAWRT